MDHPHVRALLEGIADGSTYLWELARTDPDRLVALLEADQELLAPRYRAAEQAATLLARAARRLGPRTDDGTLLVQTRVPEHDVLLARYSGQDDIVVGTPIANRTRVELESIVGFFANTLPMRVELGGARTFRALVRHVRQVVVEAFSHRQRQTKR